MSSSPQRSQANSNLHTLLSAIAPRLNSDPTLQRKFKEALKQYDERQERGRAALLEEGNELMAELRGFSDAIRQSSSHDFEKVVVECYKESIEAARPVSAGELAAMILTECLNEMKEEGQRAGESSWLAWLSFDWKSWLGLGEAFKPAGTAHASIPAGSECLTNPILERGRGNRSALLNADTFQKLLDGQAALLSKTIQLNTTRYTRERSEMLVKEFKTGLEKLEKSGVWLKEEWKRLDESGQRLREEHEKLVKEREKLEEQAGGTLGSQTDPVAVQGSTAEAGEDAEARTAEA